MTCMGAPGAVEKGTARAALRQVVFVGFHRVRHAQAQFAGFRAQGLPGDAQQEGGPVLIPELAGFAGVSRLPMAE